MGVVLSCLFLVALWSPAGKGLTSCLLCLLCFVTFANVSWSTSELMARLAPWNWFKPSSKIFYWPFQGGASFADLLCFFLSCVCYAFVHVCLYVPCGHLLGKGWSLGSRLWCLTVSLSLSHWYPGSGVVLDCNDFWSLQPYLLSNYCNVSSWRNTLIKLTHYDNTKKMTHDSQIVRAKETLKLSHGGSNYLFFFHICEKKSQVSWAIPVHLILAFFLQR